MENMVLKIKNLASKLGHYYFFPQFYKSITEKSKGEKVRGTNQKGEKK
jgi:hypothetical protein